MSTYTLTHLCHSTARRLCALLIHLSYCWTSFSPAVLFLLVSINAANAGLPLASGTCQDICRNKCKDNVNGGQIIPDAVPKTACEPTPPAFIIPGRLRADLRSAERLAGVIFGDLSSAQWTCQSSSPAGHNETSAEGWKRHQPHAHCFGLPVTCICLMLSVCAQRS